MKIFGTYILAGLIAIGAVLSFVSGSTPQATLMILMSSLQLSVIGLQRKIATFVIATLLVLVGVSLSRSGVNSVFVVLPLVAGFILALCIVVSYIPIRLRRIFGVLVGVGLLLPVAHYVFNSIFQSHFEPRRGLLSNGNWAYVDPDVSGLNIRTQYSYDIFLGLIEAELVSLDDISEYDELWVITPTSPLLENDLERLRSWVASGGRLVVVADHTDLFGHACVLNPLLEVLGLSLERNAIIGYNGGGGVFRSFWKAYNGLTACSISGGAIPFLHVIGYDDGIDYSSKSFFDDFRITSEDYFSLFNCGVFGAYGRGSYTVFGDSTLFSNFGITRPSSQAILMLLINPLLPSALACVLFGTILYICVRFILPSSRSAYLVFALLTSGAVATHSLLPRYELSWPSGARDVAGDWDLLENQQGYATPTAAAYFASKAFPRWGNRSLSDQILIGVNSYEKRAALSGKRITTDSSFVKLITASLSESTRELLGVAQEVRFEHLYYGDFWFNNGVGPIRDNIFRRFWGSENSVNIDLTPKYVNCSIRMRGDLGELKVPMYQIFGFEDWYVLGDGIVAKVVAEGGLLVRKHWQIYSLNKENIILNFKNNNTEFDATFD